MTSSLLRIAPSVAVLFALETGCTSPGATRPKPAEKSTVTAEDIAKHENEPIEKVLQAKVPGLEVTRSADGSIALRIRGTTSTTGDDAPLYVLDGVTITPGADGALLGVDPYSIQSIKVLKGADAGIYGIQGMNGVIVVTTKKPGKPR